jgi:hypothetical protein
MKKSQPLLRKPQVRVLLVVFFACLCYLYLAAKTGRPIIVNLINFLFGLVFVTFFLLILFSQFVLPLRKLTDRARAIQRLFTYMLGAGGPAIFIENGEVKTRPGELEKRKPGVMILDTASGAVLRNDVAFTRVVGPGLVFTHAGEYLAGSVDLHRQTAPLPPLGPIGNDEPFSPKKRDENDEAYEQRQKRRLETSGLTRDGVEVVPNVLVIYRLERLPGDEDISFGFNPNAVELWVRTAGVSRDKTVEDKKDKGDKSLFGRTSHVELQKLPAYLAVDVWREYLQKFTLGELFVSPVEGPRQDETGLETILRMVRLRLTSFQVEELDNIGQPTGRIVPSQEFQLLQDCGIRVDGASVSNLRFKPEVERKLVDDWVATWLQRAQTERERIEARRVAQAEEGKRMALLRFAAASTRRFDRELLSLPRPKEQGEALFQMKITLDRLLRGTLQECFLEPQLQQRLGNELNSLSEIINWIRVQEP